MTRMRYDHFFWDFDGTLLDTYPSIVRAFARGAAALGVEVDAAALMPLAKVSLGHLSQELERMHGLPAEAFRDGFRARQVGEGFEAMPPLDGIPALLRRIMAEGGRNYLYTHSGDKARRALAFRGLMDCFADAVTADDGFPSKPAPDALLHLIAKHGLAPARCVMIGDRDIDVQAGLNAGMAGVLLDLGGYYDHFAIDDRFRSVAAMEAFFVGG